MSTEASGRKQPRTRMTKQARREQLLDVGRRLFAERGVEGTSVEEIAAQCGVSKPVVYEHFGGKEGLYAVVVDREIQNLLTIMTSALTAEVQRARQVLERAALALLDYIESNPDGFRILVRDSPVTTSESGFATIMSDITSRVEHILGYAFTARGYAPGTEVLYSQMLVGAVAMTGQFWLDTRQPDKATVAAQLVNFAWNGLSNLEHDPALTLPEAELRDY